MNNRFSMALSAFGVAVLLSGFGAAFADEAQGPGQGQGRPHNPEHMIQRFDKNGNHALEASEVPPKMWAHISVADADKDGSVTLKELQDAYAAGKLQWHHQGGPGGQDANH